MIRLALASLAVLAVAGCATPAADTTAMQDGLTQEQRDHMQRVGDEFAAKYVNNRPQVIPGSGSAPPAQAATPSPHQACDHAPSGKPFIDCMEAEVDKAELAARQAGPATSMGNGTFLVGTDIVPGTYRSDGPLRTSCYWARLSGTGGETSEIIANNLGKGQATVTIKKSDKAFESSGCTRWHKVS